jgi:adenosylhomocysteine nucleosidase
LGHVIAVTGTKREAAVLLGMGIVSLPIAGRSVSLDSHLPPISALISFGMAGALDPALRIGDWVIGERVCGGFEHECDPAWVTALARQFPVARRGSVYADGNLIVASAKKIGLFQTTGALAVDMESNVVAETANRLGVPFAVLRCISDEASHTLPPAIGVAMRPDGGLDIGAIIGSLLRNPVQLPALLTSGVRFNRAFRIFKAGVQACPDRLTFDLR